MAIDVVMPQMGESIAEGTVTRWIKKVGDRVERDEPLFEISTDKVDAEIPSPAAGVLSEILAAEGKTVPVNSVVARLAAEGEAAQPSAAPPKPAPQPEAKPAAAAPPAPPAKPAAAPAPAPAPAAPPQKPAAPAAAAPQAAPGSIDERRRTRSSPVVRKIAEQNSVDISAIQGTGISGRVTKQDILDHIAKGPAPAAQPARAPRADAPAFAPGELVHIEPMSVMRKKIADHMVMSKRTSAHVSTVFEVDFTEVDKLRRKHKAAYAERGVNLTFMPFIAQAVIEGLREFPIINASLDGDNILYKREINIGIAVALDWGLIVPVLKHADEKNILGIARAINDLGDRARNKKLAPDDVQGGTFTITNPGVFGGLFGLPIINQPQLAILGVGGIKKRPVVIETDEGDAIVIRSMCYLALTFDHRLIDGAVADQFMARIRSVIEDGQFAM
ncbi:MAG: 2-oxoglutarate dehydrogenase, E2 component, dihydrolipoamide succinyltransferase [Thermoanaerobaculia bacterium]